MSAFTARQQMDVCVSAVLKTVGDLLDGVPAKGQQDVSLSMDSFWRIAVLSKCKETSET
jgi:hypothetical protein